MRIGNICIGGPNDGQLVEPHHDRVYVNGPAAGQQTAYWLLKLAGEQERFGVFVVEGMTADEALRRLLDNYVPRP